MDKVLDGHRASVFAAGERFMELLEEKAAPWRIKAEIEAIDGIEEADASGEGGYVDLVMEGGRTFYTIETYQAWHVVEGRTD